jgi:hypothetical protein
LRASYVRVKQSSSTLFTNGKSTPEGVFSPWLIREGAYPIGSIFHGAYFWWNKIRWLKVKNGGLIQLASSRLAVNVLARIYDVNSNKCKKHYAKRKTNANTRSRSRLLGFAAEHSGRKPFCYRNGLEPVLVTRYGEYREGNGCVRESSRKVSANCGTARFHVSRHHPQF